MDNTDKHVSEIKALLNEGKTEDEINEQYPHFSKSKIVKIKYGYIHASVPPETPQQLKSKSRRKVNVENRGVIKENSPQEEKKYPRSVVLTITDQETDEWVLKVLKDRERDIQKQLAIVTLKLYALQTGDYSDLPPSAIKDLEEIKTRMNGGEDIEDILKTA